MANRGDILTRWLPKDDQGRILVNADGVSVPDLEVMDNDQSSRGIPRDSSGAILVSLPSVVRTVNGEGPDGNGNVDIAGGGSGGSAIATFEQPGALEVVAGRGLYPLPSPQRLTRVVAAVSTPPTGAAIRVDVNRNGTSIFTDESQRPSIPDGAYKSAVKSVDVALSTADILTVDIDQVGSTQPGANLTVALQLGVPAPPTPTAPHITSPASADASQGAAFSHTVTTTGEPAPALTKTGSLPAGLTFVDNNDGTATIAGTPTASGSFSITITATNATSPAATQTFALTVAAPFSYSALPGYADEWDVSLESGAPDSALASVADRGPGSHPLVQSTAGARPLVKIANGRKVARFDGSNDALAAAFTLESPFTLYVVGSIASGGLLDGFNQLTFALSKAGATRALLSTNGGGSVDLFPVGDLGDLRVFTIVSTGTELSMAVDDGSLLTDTSASPTGLGGLTFGQAGYAFDACDLGHALVYTAVHSTGDRQAVVSNLMNEWGIS